MLTINNKRGKIAIVLLNMLHSRSKGDITQEVLQKNPVFCHLPSEVTGSSRP